MRLSNSDINRVICPVDIKDVIYSEEKGLTVNLSGKNAFVKFLVVKKDGKEMYSIDSLRDSISYATARSIR